MKSVPQRKTQKLNSWVGSHISDVMLSYGNPTNEVPDGKDGKIYIFDVSTTTTTKGKTKVVTNDDGEVEEYEHIPSETKVNQRMRMFHTDAKGVVYKVRWSGL